MSFRGCQVGQRRQAYVRGCRQSVWALGSALYLALAALSAAPVAAQTEGVLNAQDWRALVALYEAMEGESWTRNDHWNVATIDVPSAGEVGLWYGVSVESNRVVALDLSDNGLTGTLPQELGYLTAIRSIRLQRNALTGPIPSQVGDLENLRELYLQSNRLSEPIPPELAKLRPLELLNLRGNRLTGTLPPELGQLGALRKMWLFSNDLSGPVPAEWTGMSRLSALHVHDNPGLLGAVPIEIWDQLDEPMSQRGTGLCIPSKAKDTGEATQAAESNGGFYPCLHADDLVVLRAMVDSTDGSAWRATWPMPGASAVRAEDVDAWHGVTVRGNQVTALDLSYNGLRGELPAALGSLDALEALDLSFNGLAGAVPLPLTLSTSLQSLKAEGTQLCLPMGAVFAGTVSAAGLAPCANEAALISPSAQRAWARWLWLAGIAVACVAGFAGAWLVQRKRGTVQERELGAMQQLLRGIDQSVARVEAKVVQKAALAEGPQKPDGDLARLKELVESTHAAIMKWSEWFGGGENGAAASDETLERLQHGVEQLLTRLDAMEQSSDRAAQHTREQSNADGRAEKEAALIAAVEARENEIQRLKIGYDNFVTDKYVKRLIRTSQAAAYLIKHKPEAAKELGKIQRMLKGALEECNVEPYAPPEGADFRFTEGVADHPDRIASNDKDQEHKIAEVVEPGWAMRTPDKLRILVPAQVAVYQYNNQA